MLAYHQILSTRLDHILGNKETTRRQYIARDADATYMRSNKDRLNTELIHRRKSIDGFTTRETLGMSPIFATVGASCGT